MCSFVFLKQLKYVDSKSFKKNSRKRARFVHAQGGFRFFLAFWLHAETAVVQDLCLVEGDTKIEICRGKWGSGRKKLHILLGKLALDWCNIDREVPNNVTLAW